MSSTHLRQRAYDYLHERILSGALVAGSQVSELSLAREIGISRTPVREAIRRLVHEGLLEQLPRYGTIVRAPQRQDLVELFEVREALEGHAVALATERLHVDDLARLERLCDQMALLGDELEASGATVLDPSHLQRFLAADLAFHMLLMRAAGNGRLLKIVADSRLLTGIFGTPRQQHTLHVVRDTHRHHNRILRAIKKGDGDTARRLLTEHIRASKQASLEHFDRTQGARAAALPLGLPADLLAALDRIEQSTAGPEPAARPRPRARA
ncbi:MAG: GntR family transcriptional regulator [Planctomycetia bacterium]|nr:GntR family transcriptional regulator [Planctomycetia bacterium]